MKNIKKLLLVAGWMLFGFSATAQTLVRYVRIQQNGTQPINLTEVRAIQTGTGTNLALNKTVTSNSTHQCCSDTYLVDGSLGNYAASDLFGTTEYFEIDLGAAYSLSQIEIVNRYDCCQDRAADLQLILKNGSGTQVSSQQINAYQNQNSAYQTNWLVNGESLDFDGTNDYVEFANTGLSASAGTFECWFRNDVANSAQQILDLGGEAFSIFIWGDGKLYFRAGGNQFSITYSTTATWQHLAMVWSGSGNTFYGYLNGVQIGSGTQGASGISGASGRLGQVTIAASYPYNGRMDEVRMWNVARPLAAIQSTMNCELSNVEHGLVRQYKLNQSSGTTATDATGNANGTLTNFALSGSSSNWVNTTGVTGTCTTGAALNFDGSNDHVEIPDANNLDFTNNLTLEAWVKIPSYPAEGSIISKNRGSGGNGYKLFIYSNGKAYLLLNNTATQVELASATTIPLNTWTHIAGTFSGGTTMKVFINGVESASQTISSFTLLNSTQPVYLGNGGPGSPTNTFLLNGSIDEARLWNVARTQAQISGAMNCELLGTETGLAAYYKFNQYGTTSLLDASPNANNGTLTNFSLSGNTSNWVTPGGLANGTSCLVVNITGATTGCGSTTLTADGGGTYAWTGGATTADATFTASGTYTVSVTNNGSTATASASVTIHAPPAAPTFSGATTACDQVTLTASGGTSFNWSNGANTAAAVFSETGTYTVTATDANGCTASASAAVTVNKAAPSIAGDAAGCDEVELTASGGSLYVWTGGATGANATFDAPGTYAVTATDANGCTGVAMHTIIIVNQSKTYYLDADGDGYGNSSNPVQSCTPLAGYILLGLDCNDASAAINPGAAEVCDQIDNNCNGILIETACGGSNAPVSPACASRSTVEVLNGQVFFNYGSATDAINTSQSSSFTIGQPVVDFSITAGLNLGFGFWTRFLLAPSAPVVTATEGDLPDRVQINWSADPLSPAANGYKIYRDGALLATVDDETFAFIDFNVLAGQFYTYSVAGTNQFGEGKRGSALGFLNPNGVVTGQVKTFSGNPVVGATVKLTPTLGTAVEFDGISTVFSEYEAEFPRSEFTISTWVKIADGNPTTGTTGIFDFGSSIGKNWWLHALTPADGSKTVRFGIGKNLATKTEVEYTFPELVKNDWHYVAASFNGSALLFYIDGELVQTAVGEIAADSTVLFLGKRSDEGGYFKGKIDEFRLFERQLAQTEIQAAMNQTISGTTDGLVSYWKFDEGTGSKGFDISENKTKMHLCGARWTTDKPAVVNAGVSDATGFYKIEGINYSSGQTFTATPYKNFYFNQSLEFNGANETSATLTNFDLPDSSTIEITVKNFDFASNQVILSKNGHFELGTNAGNLILKIGSTTQNWGALGMGFHRLSFQIEQTGSSAAVIFYKNGALVGSHTFTGVASDFSSGTAWTLGKNSTGNYFTGLIDEVAFFSTLLPLSDLQTFANIGTNVTHPKLSSYFNLNEGERTSLRDMGTSLTGSGSTSGASWSTVAAISETLPHEFTPSSRLVTLNPSNTSADQIDFTDQSTIPISGYARFENTDCFQKQVEILVNGVSKVPQVFTDVHGKFVLDLEPGETARLSPKFEDHSFYPAFWDIQNVASPVAGILFRNQTKRKVVGQLAGNETCRKSIIPAGSIVKVKVATLNGCFEQVKTLTGAGKFVFDGVPPDSVTVAVIQHSNPVIYTFFQNLGGATLDLKTQNDTIDFIYLAPPQVELSPLDTNFCGDAMLEMAQQAQVTVKVFEEYDGGVCYLDSAKLTINNGMADKSQYDTLMTGGQFKLKFKAGSPQIAAPHLKFLQVTAEAHDELATAGLSAVVLGRRARQTTFASTSPEIPTLILRDPPGDGSTAYIEKGQTTCQTWGFSAAYGSNLDVKASISLGADLTTSVGLGAEVELEIEATLDRGIETSTKFNNMTTNESETCLTTTERIATSENDAVVGSAGGADVYMGGAINYIFGITDELEFDTATCSFVLDKGLVIFPDGFATTFIYSEYQITSVVIPNLLTIGDTVSANRWQDIIALNTRLKNEAVFSRNLSFDAGVTYEQSETSEASKTISHEWSVEFDAQFVNEFGLEINGIGLSAGLTMGFTTTQSGSSSTTTTDTRTVGFTLADDDLRDNFTVNIKKDKAYGTLVFQTVSGQSACPWEPNTQNREEVQLTIDHNVAVNVPENDVAVFQVNLGNTSPSGEVGFYFLELVPESNPDGATFAANGVDLTGAVLFQIPPNGSLPLTVTIGKGASEFDYTGLRIAARSGCEFDGAIQIGIPREQIDPKFYKEVVVDVHFLEPCSPVNVGFPLENWVHTVAAGPNLSITLDGYDTADPDLELIRVQYRRSQGDGAWINIAEIPKADLGQVFEIVEWATATLQDGEYDIRAVTQCFSGALNPGISKVVKGKFERQPPVIFGTPEPADGVLSSGDEISIMFNEAIRCDLLIQADQFDNNNVGLYNTRTGDLVDAIVTCSGDKITIVPNVPNQFLENDVHRVEIDNIKDLANNTFLHGQWEFVIDRNNLNWVDNVPVYVSKFEEEIKSETRRIENRGGFNQSFDITGVPDWVRVFPKSGTLAPGAVQVITFEFDSTLFFGKYLDTIKLEGALGDEPLEVQCRVVCKDPGWVVNAGDWDYSHNFTLSFDIEGTLSADIEDIVGAYVGNELRGTAKLRYLAPVNKYEAFLTVYSNNFSGETVNFRIWDASECLLFGAVLESFPFQADGLNGSPQSPVILHTNNQVLREIELNSGWNWISFNLAFPNSAVAAALASVTHPTNDLVKSQTQFSQNSAGLGWVGSLATLGNTSMYQYRTSDRDTILHLGTLIDPTSMPISVAAGWNWIGYLPQQALTVGEALESLTPLNGDLIKSQTEFAQYVAGFGWLGNLLYMSPPKGYLLKMANAGTLTYPNSANRPNLTPQPPLLWRGGVRSPLLWRGAGGEVWTVDPTKFEHSQTMIAMLKNDGANVTKADFELGAFTQSGECRGAAKAIWIEPLQSHLFFLTMYANQSGEVLTFKTADEKGQISDLKETIFFASDAQTGTVQQPFEFQFGTSAAEEDASSMTTEEPFLDVLPNPVSDYATIRFRSPEAGFVKFEIADAAGKSIQTFDFEAIKGMNALLWEEVGNLPKGVYLLKLRTEDLILTEKVIVR